MPPFGNPNALFRDGVSLLPQPQNRLSPSQIWPMENPVGTEQVRPQYLTNPDPDVVPGVMWGGRMTSPRVAQGLNNAIAIGEGFVGGTGPSPTKLPTWYHGTASKFDKFNTPEVYLTDSMEQASQYAANAHRLGQGGQGKPEVLSINPKPGNVQNIDDHLFDAMDDGIDLDDAILEAATAARKARNVRYLEYTHPNAGSQGEHTVRISLYPHEDLIRSK
jgi:hypothetical protein